MKKIGGFFNSVKKVFGKKHKKNGFEINYDNTKFQDFLKNLDISDPEYESVRKAVDCCEEAIYLSEKRIAYSEELQNIYIKEKDLELFNEFSREQLKSLQEKIDEYKTISKEKKGLKNQVENYDRAFDYLAKIEHQVEPAIKEMQYHERRQSGLKRDIAYIQGEKEELIYDKEQLENSLDFLYKFSIVFVCVMAVITFTMGLFKIALNKKIFIPAVLLAVFTIVVGTATYYFQRKFRFELEMNARLQIRAVELLNRAKVLYANCTSFLNFEYKKYKVKSSEMLKSNWDEYLYQKQINKKHIAINNRMLEIFTDIEKLFKKKGIQDVQNLFESLLYLINLDDKKLLQKEIKEIKERTQRELEDLNLRQEKLWDSIMELQRKDMTEGHIISDIVNAYEQEVQKLLEKLAVKKEI